MRNTTGEEIQVQMSDSTDTASDGTKTFTFNELRKVNKVISAQCEDSGYIVQNAGIANDNEVTVQAYQSAGSAAALASLATATDVGTVTVTVAGE